MSGDRATALALFEHFLQISAGITVHELRRDPTWDRSVAQQPAFQAIDRKEYRRAMNVYGLTCIQPMGEPKVRSNELFF